MVKAIARELREHAPFTVFGAGTGIALMVVVVVARVPGRVLEPAFESMHGLHVLLSAVTTAAMYRRHRGGIAVTLVIGYVGAVGLGTLSDIVLPYLGGRLVGAEVSLHLAFIEHWWLINPLALLGGAAGILWQTTKVPHGGHVLLSTWASLFYLTAHGQANWLPLLPLVLVVLFVAVWVPCCVSDIVLPLLFAPGEPGDHHEGHGH